MGILANKSMTHEDGLHARPLRASATVALPTKGSAAAVRGISSRADEAEEVSMKDDCITF